MKKGFIKKISISIIAGIMVSLISTSVKASNVLTQSAIEADMKADLGNENGYIDVYMPVPSVNEENVNAVNNENNSSYADIPAKYTSPILTSVKNQGNYEVCWAFAAVAAAEADILTDNPKLNGEVDLSELQLAYFFYNTQADELWGTNGDKTIANNANYLLRGGNSIFTTFALAKWTGLAAENKAVFPENGYPSLDASLAYDGEYHLQNAYWINFKDTEDVKCMIMEHGAVASGYYSVGSKYNNSDDGCAYYDADNTSTNHAIAIVGWDDNYKKENFSDAQQPKEDGAWLVKNSWGSDWGDEGYFWMSYETASINTENAKVFVFDCEGSDNYDHNYQYDGSCGNRTGSVYNGGSIANVFEVKGNTKGIYEKLEAVSFALYSANVDYSIQIYKNIEEGNPESGTPLLKTPLTGSTKYTGYYTIELEEPLWLTKGQNYSVVITLSQKKYVNVNYFLDYTYDNGDWISFVSNYKEGESFSKKTAEDSWEDMAHKASVCRIKAFTTDDEGILADSVLLSENSLIMDTGDTHRLSAGVLPDNVSDATVMWSSSDETVAKVDKSGNITAVGKGSAVIKAYSAGKEAFCEVNVRKELSELDINISETAYTYNGNEIKPEVIIKDGEKVLSNGVDYTVFYTDNINAGRAKVVISGMGAYKGSKTEEFTIVPKSLEMAVISGIKDKKYTGSAVWQELTVEIEDTKLVENKDYIIEYFNNIAQGTALVKVTGTGNYTSSIQREFMIIDVPEMAAKLSAKCYTKKIKISWEGIDGADGYILYRYNSKKKKYEQIADTSKTCYTNTKLSKEKTYKYKMKAYKIFEGKRLESEYSPVLITSTTTSAPSISAKKASPKSIKVSWKRLKKADGYEVYKSVKKKSGFKLAKRINKGKTTSTVIKGLKKNKTYYIKVRTFIKVDGKRIYSDFSKVKKVKLK